MSDETQDFQRFLGRREEAARAYVSGASAPLGEIVSHTAPATLFGTGGGYQQDPEEIAVAFANGARRFEPGSDSNLEILQMAAEGGIAYWVGIQRATARMKGHPAAVSFRLRITEIYRREGDDWKLIHRHADSLTTESGALTQD